MLPLKATLFQRTGRGDPLCSRYGCFNETTTQLFLECPSSRAMAFSSKWGLKLDAIGTSNAQDLVRWSLNPSHHLSLKLGGKDFTSLLLASFLYVVWEFQNDKVFEDKSSIVRATVRCESLVEEYNLVSLKRKSISPSHKIERWSPHKKTKSA